MENKTLDLNMIFNSEIDYSTRNRIDLPIEKQYYLVIGEKQLCIHQMNGTLGIYAFNFIPKYYTNNRIEFRRYKWNKLITYPKRNKELCIQMFKEYAREMIGEKKGIELRDVIKYLMTMEEIQNAMQ